MNYIKSAKLGFDKDQIIVLKNGGGLSKADRQSFLNSIKQLSGVKNAATSGTILGQGLRYYPPKSQGFSAGTAIKFCVHRLRFFECRWR